MSCTPKPNGKWSLSLWKIAISLGIYPTFSDKPHGFSVVFPPGSPALHFQRSSPIAQQKRPPHQAIGFGFFQLAGAHGDLEVHRTYGALKATRLTESRDTYRDTQTEDLGMKYGWRSGLIYTKMIEHWECYGIPFSKTMAIWMEIMIKSYIYIYTIMINYGGFHKWGFPMVYFLGNPSRNEWFRGCTPPSMETSIWIRYDTMIWLDSRVNFQRVFPIKIHIKWMAKPPYGDEIIAAPGDFFFREDGLPNDAARVGEMVGFPASLLNDGPLFFFFSFIRALDWNTPQIAQVT